MIKLNNWAQLSVVLLLWACAPQPENVTTTISGEIINPIGDVITFRLGGDRITDTLDADNKFSTAFDITAPVDIVFGHGGEITYLYLRPGDQLYLTLDPAEFDESLTYSGKGAEINNYKAAMVLLGDSLLSTRDLYKMPEDQFLVALDSISAIELGYMADFNIDDAAFIAYTRENSKWSDMVTKMRYEGAHRSLLDLDSFSVSDTYYDFQLALDVNDTTLLKYPAFRSYVDESIEKEASKGYYARADESEDYSGFYVEAINALIQVPSLKEQLMYEFISDSYSYFPAEVRDEIVAAWKGLNPDPERVDEIDQMITEFQKLEPGNPAPDFRYVSIDGDTLTMADFKGKLVYIDVWATWCGPCIAEHPHMEKLQQRFEGQDVAFVAVSTDSSPDPWRKMVNERKLGGIHLYAPGAWQSTIITDYLIQGIPRFILIDREGNIIDANASRPSGDIGDQLEALLKSA